MTVEKAIEILSDVGDINRCCSEDAEALDMAIKALEQQPCEDCISREEVLEQAKDYGSNTYLIPVNSVKTLPSVKPTRPTGKWIEKEDYNLDTYYECSECGADYCIEGDILIHKYCPNCGARMTESEEEKCR